jgi:hypothetical protein
MEFSLIFVIFLSTHSSPPHFSNYSLSIGMHTVAQLVEALRYESEGRWFDSRWCHPNPSARPMTLGSTQPLAEMSTRNISWGVKEAGA